MEYKKTRPQNRERVLSAGTVRWKIWLKDVRTSLWCYSKIGSYFFKQLPSVSDKNTGWFKIRMQSSCKMEHILLSILNEIKRTVRKTGNNLICTTEFDFG